MSFKKLPKPILMKFGTHVKMFTRKVSKFFLAVIVLVSVAMAKKYAEIAINAYVFR